MSPLMALISVMYIPLFIICIVIIAVYVAAKGEKDNE